MKLLFIRNTYVHSHACNLSHSLMHTHTHRYSTYSICTDKSSRALCKLFPITKQLLLYNTNKMRPPPFSISYFHMAFSSNWCVFLYQIVIGHRLIWFILWEFILSRHNSCKKWFWVSFMSFAACCFINWELSCLRDTYCMWGFCHYIRGLLKSIAGI